MTVEISHVPHISTTPIYLCKRKHKTIKNMWLAVIISVCLAVEVLSYLSGGELRLNKKEEKTEENTVFPTQTSLRTLP